MLYGFIGRVSAANSLREGLDISAERTRLISDRVAKASLDGADGFATTLEGVQATMRRPGDPVDLESEMVGLADEQLRFETAARLLQKTYQSIRSSLRDR